MKSTGGLSNRGGLDFNFTCHFTELLHYLSFSLGFGNVAHKEAQVGDANVNFQVPAALHFHVIQLICFYIFSIMILHIHSPISFNSSIPFIFSISYILNRGNIPV